MASSLPTRPLNTSSFSHSPSNPRRHASALSDVTADSRSAPLSSGKKGPRVPPSSGNGQSRREHAGSNHDKSVQDMLQDIQLIEAWLTSVRASAHPAPFNLVIQKLKRCIFTPAQVKANHSNTKNQMKTGVRNTANMPMSGSLANGQSGVTRFHPQSHHSFSTTRSLPHAPPALTNHPVAPVEKMFPNTSPKPLHSSSSSVTSTFSTSGQIDHIFVSPSTSSNSSRSMSVVTGSDHEDQDHTDLFDLDDLNFDDSVLNQFTEKTQAIAHGNESSLRSAIPQGVCFENGLWVIAPDATKNQDALSKADDPKDAPLLDVRSSAPLLPVFPADLDDIEDDPAFVHNPISNSSTVISNTIPSEQPRQREDSVIAHSNSLFDAMRSDELEDLDIGDLESAVNGSDHDDQVSEASEVVESSCVKNLGVPSNEPATSPTILAADEIDIEELERYDIEEIPVVTPSQVNTLTSVKKDTESHCEKPMLEQNSISTVLPVGETTSNTTFADGSLQARLIRRSCAEYPLQQNFPADLDDIEDVSHTDSSTAALTASASVVAQPANKVLYEFTLNEAFKQNMLRCQLSHNSRNINFNSRSLAQANVISDARSPHITLPFIALQAELYAAKLAQRSAASHRTSNRRLKV